MTNDTSGWTRRRVIQGLAVGSAAMGLGGATASEVRAAGGKLPRVEPESVGISSAAILAFLDGVEQKVGGLHSFMLLRQGKVAAQGWWAPYGAEYPHMLYSLSKSFTSTAVGLAVEQGLLTVDSPVVSFFPGDLPASVSENLAAMRVRHLLSMSTGHDKDATGPARQAPDGNWVRGFLSLPVEHAPGSKFVYNSAATYMLSAIVQKLTGSTLLEYLRPKLFAPIGIEKPTWESCPRGINTGGWGLSIRTEDIARFGQLYLRQGMWGDRRLIPEAWIREATSKQIANGSNPNSDWNQGYGYQFWRCRHNAYRGDGAFGQYCVVMPEQDAVLAITSGLGDMQAVLSVAWDTLLPGFAATSGTPEPGLKPRLASLRVPLPAGRKETRLTPTLSGRTVRFSENAAKLESATATFRADHCELTIRQAGVERRLRCGYGEWVKGKAPLDARPEAPIGAACAWESDDTFVWKICYVDTPYVLTSTWKLAGDEVTQKAKMNVSFGATEQPPVVGRIAAR